MPIAATSSVTESGSRRTPVSSAVRPRQTDRKSGTTKNSPACMRNWKKNITSPPLSWWFRSMSVRTSGSWPRASRYPCQRKKTQITNSPARTSHTVGERPAHEGPSGFGWIQPHSLERRTPKTRSASPSAERTAPTRSSCGRFSVGASAIRRVSSRIASTISTSPAKTQRQEKYVVKKPPISGPSATAIAPAAATSPYAAGRRSAGKLPATSATIAGRISAAPTPSRNDQPKSSTGRLGASAVVNDPQP